MIARDQIRTLRDTFDSVAHLLQPAIDRGLDVLTLDDYRDRVLTGDMQLWVDEGYAAVTEVLNYPRSRVVLVHLAGGELDPLMEADGELRNSPASWEQQASRSSAGVAG